MTAPLRQQQIRIDPVAVFIARVEARAMLWAAREITLHDAVDELWTDAVRNGLVAQLGVDKTQELLATAFAPVRDDLPCHEDAVPDEIVIDDEDAGVPSATLRAAEYLLQLGDLERWREWFDAHSAQERATILQHLEQRKRRRGK
jgi:hypothetical protein